MSSPTQSERLTSGLEYLEGLGMRVKVALSPSKYYGKFDYLFSSDDAKRRAEALKKLILDPDVKAIISARGGYGCLETLPYIDFNCLKRRPKPLVGFSDTSALLLAFYKASGIMTIHGPNIESSFAKASGNPDCRKSVEHLMNFLQAGELSALNLRHLYGRKSAKGKLIGGNLSLIATLLGTAWQANFRKHIVFIEDTRERPHRVHRMLLQLKLAGCFKDVLGVIIGDFKDSEEVGKPSLAQIFCDIFKNSKIPVWECSQFGHKDLNLPLPLGIEVRLSQDKLEFLDNPAIVKT